MAFAGTADGAGKCLEGPLSEISGFGLRLDTITSTTHIAGNSVVERTYPLRPKLDMDAGATSWPPRRLPAPRRPAAEVDAEETQA